MSAASIGPTGAGGGTGKTQRRGSGKGYGNFSRSYPRGVCVDFRKLSYATVLNYIDHHGEFAYEKLLLIFIDIPLIFFVHFWLGVPVRSEAAASELACQAARHFEAMEVNEEECIGGFLQRLENPSASQNEYARTTAHFDGHAPALAVRKRQRAKLAARPGEQVAAKVTRTDENGSWILATVQRFYADNETVRCEQLWISSPKSHVSSSHQYDVQDDDDTSKLIRLPWNHVMRLSMGTEGSFVKGTDCMAIFPETTSFYRARVSKQPVWKVEGPVPIVREMIVKFEDDEDNNNRTPHRRVPARYVIPIPGDYFYDEVEDVDLSLIGGSTTAAVK